MKTVWQALQRAVGIDEVLITIGLGLATVGLWTWIGPGALTLPGLVLLWIVVPARQPFISRPADPTAPPRSRR